MEILSIGEKIKRARVYKGYTLKDICEDKVSVSKMSCIENNKIEPEEWILEIVSKKLDLSLEYLNQGIQDQLKKNYNLINEMKDREDYRMYLKNNLEYAENYGYFDIALKFMHLLFEYDLKRSDCEELSKEVTRYCKLCRRNYIDENIIMYYIDIGKYFYINKEFYEALNYFETITKILTCDKKLQCNMLNQALFYGAMCYLELGKESKAYKNAVKLFENASKFESEDNKKDIYKLMALISIKVGTEKFEEYDDYLKEFYNKDIVYRTNKLFKEIIQSINGIHKNNIEEYLKNISKDMKDNNEEEIIEAMLCNIKDIIELKDLDSAEILLDFVINYAIDINKLPLIEKAYYYKGIVLLKNDNKKWAETYMNLSLDLLLKFGTKKDIYEKYINMANFYYKIEDVKEAVKYFDLALSMKNKI